MQAVPRLRLLPGPRGRITWPRLPPESRVDSGATLRRRGQDHRRSRGVLPPPGGRPLAAARDRARLPLPASARPGAGLAEHPARLVPRPRDPATDGDRRLSRGRRRQLGPARPRRRHPQALPRQAPRRGNDLPHARLDPDRRDALRHGGRRRDPRLGPVRSASYRGWTCCRIYRRWTGAGRCATGRRRS